MPEATNVINATSTANAANTASPRVRPGCGSIYPPVRPTNVLTIPFMTLRRSPPLILALILTILLFGFCRNGAAYAATDLVVIANPGSGIEHLSRDEAIALYMGRSKKLSSGIAAQPIDQSSKTPVRASFYSELINKELAEVNSYWARLKFSGQSTPPRQVDTTAEVLQIVSSNNGAIGYIPRSAVDKRVKIVLDLAAPK